MLRDYPHQPMKTLKQETIIEKLIDKLIKNDSTDKEKQVLKIRPDCSVSPETSSLKLTIEIVADSMIME